MADGKKPNIQTITTVFVTRNTDFSFSKNRYRSPFFLCLPSLMVCKNVRSHSLYTYLYNTVLLFRFLCGIINPAKTKTGAKAPVLQDHFYVL